MFTRDAVVIGVTGWILGGLVFWPAAVQAAGNLKLGPLEIHPLVLVTESFDDNVCRSESKDCPQDGEIKEGRDSITLYHPGLLLILPLRDHQLQAEYQGDFARYSEFDDENYSDNTFRGNAALNFPGGLSIRAEDTWVDGHDPRGFAQNVELDFYTKNTASAAVRHPVGPKLWVEVRLAHFMLDYEETRNDFRDRTDTTIGGTIFYDLFPKTSVLAEYNHINVTFENEEEPLSRDSTVQQIAAGVLYELTAKSKGTLKWGYEQKRFEEEDRQDFKGGIMTLGLDHEWTPRTLIQLTGERGSRESNLETEDYYVTTSGTLRATQRFGRRLSVLAETAIARDQYPDQAGEEGRRDNTLRARVGVDYWFRQWLNTNTRYEHAVRNSNEKEFEYTDNLYTIGLGLIF
jgi:hypothetical protein